MTTPEPISRKHFTSCRPPISKRTFISQAVEAKIEEVKTAIPDPELAWMFENCYPNTLDTTVDFEIIDGEPDSFVITGDIDAMWLRDSTAQVWPYMPLINEDDALKQMILGLINRQVKCVLTDPYANAFYKDLSQKSQWITDEPTPAPGVHERKWEIDSLCYVIRLSHKYYEITGDKTAFSKDWDRAARIIVKTFRTEQRKDGTSPYYFKRNKFSTLGREIRPNGLISSAFRPSDDPTSLPYLIPSNLFATISLNQLEDIYRSVLNDAVFAAECAAFAEEIRQAVNACAISDFPMFGKIYAYEVDGLGNEVLMDDANVPSLMSLAYLDPENATDPLYLNTRKFLSSDQNPFFVLGKAGGGQGSPHTGNESIWPMGIILRAMTSTDSNEILACLKTLKATHAGTGFMHESFHKDNPNKYTRPWFAWANTLFGELIIKLYHESPELLKNRLT